MKYFIDKKYFPFFKYLFSKYTIYIFKYCQNLNTCFFHLVDIIYGVKSVDKLFLKFIADFDVFKIASCYFDDKEFIKFYESFKQDNS